MIDLVRLGFARFAALELGGKAIRKKRGQISHEKVALQKKPMMDVISSAACTS
jgi:hypothetical protein